MSLPAAVIGWFAVGYLVVTIVGVAHTCFNWLILGMENEGEVHTVYDIKAYARTVPWHPVYNLLIWPVVAYFSLGSAIGDRSQVWVLGLTWCLLAIAVDMVGWVLIPHPWSMTWRELFVDYQPWITLIYATILVSPLLAALTGT